MQVTIVLNEQQKAAVEAEITETNKRIDLENRRATLDHERRQLDHGGQDVPPPTLQQRVSPESYLQHRVDEILDATVRMMSQRNAAALAQKFESADPAAQKAALDALEKGKPQK